MPFSTSSNPHQPTKLVGLVCFPFANHFGVWFEQTQHFALHVAVSTPHSFLGLRDHLLDLSCLSWKWRERSSVKITERAHAKRAKALHWGREGCHPKAALAG